MLRSRDHVFQIGPIFFYKDHMNMSFHGNHANRRYSSNFTAKNVQMEQNGTFLENFDYDHQILHKKLV